MLTSPLLAIAILASGPQTPKSTFQKRDLSKGNTMYVVPYAHLDTQWRWAYPQVIREYIPDTLNTNFALIDKYPNYIFNFSGSRRYQFMKEYYPADYEKLKKHIKAGRWFPCGSSVDESDANVPSAESLIRQILYGNKFFQKEFGVYSQEFMLPDCFGFPYALPSILAHCGTNAFSTQKLTWGSAVGIPFKIGNWEGPDGKSVVAALDPGSYAGDVDEDLSQNTSWLARIQNTGKMSGAFVDYHYYGTGDKGGGPTESSVDWVEKSIKGTGPISVVSSRADEMFRSLTPEQIEKLPRYKGELLLTEHSSGSITSQAYMKRWNRKNELLADAAERASVAATWLGGLPYPSERLYKAWDLVLGSQMHDMLPGTSIPKAYEFCWNDEILALNQFAAIETSAVGAIASAMDTDVHGQPLVVYNPLSIEREDVVEALIPQQPDKGLTVHVYGPHGETIPTQILQQGPAGTRIIFLAKVPSCGLAVYDARVEPTTPVFGELSTLGNDVIENRRFKVTVDENGDIESIFDKRANREVLKAPARLDFQYHNPSAFPAWNMDWEDAKLPPVGHVDGPAKVSIVENGPVRVTIRVEREARGSKFVQIISLSAGDAGDRVEVNNVIDWQTKEHALKASFPLTTGNPMATYDLQVGAIERGNNSEKKYEVPQHQWLDLTQPDGKYGVGILNDSKYGSDKPDDNTVRLTLLYTPGVRGGYWDQSSQDIGRHEILYAIAPHENDWRATPWTAKRLNQPLHAFVSPAHEGKLGKTFSLISSNTNQVEITAVKKAEDSNEVIVRLRELVGKDATNVRLSVPNGITTAREVDGQERNIGKAVLERGTLVTGVSAFSLRAFALKLGNPPAKVAKPHARQIALPFDTDVAATAANPADGAFNSAGETIPADLLPRQINLGGINFEIGSTKDGTSNALSCKGQEIEIPAGYSKLYLITASAAQQNGAFQFKPEGQSWPLNIDAGRWDGYVGLWDNRLWNEDLGVNFTNYNEWKGLESGFVNPTEVAWFSNHKRGPTGNQFYRYCYLYKNAVAIPSNGGKLVLPQDPNVKLLALTVANGTTDDAAPAMPLYDQLTEHGGLSAPSVRVEGKRNDVVTIFVDPPLYWRKGNLRYTLDGSDPGATSPEYAASIMVYDNLTLKAREIGANGALGPITLYNVAAADTTAPSIISGTSINDLGVARLRFSEPLDKASAENPANYRFSSDVKVVQAMLMPDYKTVGLTLDKPVQGVDLTVAVSGVKDLSSRGNATNNHSATLSSRTAVFKSPPLEPRTPKEFRPENLPVGATDLWTLNLFCKVDATPEHLTLIAGFGRAIDGRTGRGRYFSNFTKGINFWISNRDVSTEVPLDLGKWQMLTATFDGKVVRLYKNGEKIAEEADVLSNDQAVVHIMPLDAWDQKRVFQGEVRDMTIWNDCLPDSVITRLWEAAQK